LGCNTNSEWGRGDSSAVQSVVIISEHLHNSGGTGD
jgi:hypothetical protein